MGESDLHKWLGHGLVIAAWFAIPFIIGVSTKTSFRRGVAKAIGKVVLLLLMLLVVLLASFTGYMGPSHIAAPNEQTATRFKVLHLFVLPSLIAILICMTYWWMRPDKQKTSKRSINEAAEPGGVK